MAKLRPLLWFRLNVYDDDDGPWSIYLTHDKITECLKEPARPAMGCTVPDKRAVFVNARYPRASFTETVVHELVHVAFDPLVMPYWLEEQLTAGMDGAMTRMLVQLGFRLPDLPEGWELLKKRYCKRRRK